MNEVTQVQRFFFPQRWPLSAVGFVFASEEPMPLFEGVQASGRGCPAMGGYTRAL